MAETSENTLIPAAILRDTRERRPWDFEDYPVEIRDVTLSTGDYALPAHCTHDPDTDTYHPQFAVERKSGHDFLTSLTWQRDRFEREIQRAAQWTQPLSVVIETSYQTLLCDRGCMVWRDVHPNQIAGTVVSWARRYNVAFHFAETRQRAQLCAFLLLVRHSLGRQVADRTRGSE